VPDGCAECAACLCEPPPYERTVTAFDYAPPWTALIARFKFQAGLDLAAPFAQRLVRACEAASTRASLILPVPLGEARLRERGYNQAWELARRIGRSTGVRADARLLLRLRDTPHQLALPVDRRAAHVRGAFAVEPVTRAEIAGHHVALVDDVLTTGATAAEIARVLLGAQAASVQVWVVARTPRPGDG
jgi:ComF family protein